MKVNIRESGIVELICGCGIGHPSRHLTELSKLPWRDIDSMHGCCGCCSKPKFAKCERSLAGELASRKRRLQ